MRQTEHKKLKETVSRIEQRRCPFEKQFNHCTDTNCPFLHKHGGQGKQYKCGDHMVAAEIRNWHENHGFGFARKDGSDYYVHASQLKFDPRQVHVGMLINFDAMVTKEEGNCDKAVNVTISC